MNKLGQQSRKIKAKGTDLIWSQICSPLQMVLVRGTSLHLNLFWSCGNLGSLPLGSVQVVRVPEIDVLIEFNPIGEMGVSGESRCYGWHLGACVCWEVREQPDCCEQTRRERRGVPELPVCGGNQTGCWVFFMISMFLASRCVICRTSENDVQGQLWGMNCVAGTVGSLKNMTNSDSGLSGISRRRSQQQV